MITDPPATDGSSRGGRNQLPDVIFACPIDITSIPPDYEVRDVSAAVAQDSGVSSSYIIVERHGPIIDSGSTRGKQCFLEVSLIHQTWDHFSSSCSVGVYY